MARESKRVRDERRYGKPERLADLVLAYAEKPQWKIPPFATDGASAKLMGFYWTTIESIRKAITDCPIIEASSACRLYWDHPQDVWEAKDFPSAAPPFPEFFMEAGHPGTITVENGKRVEPGNWVPERWGFLFKAIEPKDDDEFPAMNRETKEIEAVNIKRKWDIGIHLVFKQGSSVCFYPVIGFMPVMENGSIVRWPTMMGGGLNVSDNEKEQIGSLFLSLLKPVLFALSFMHCKNVTLEAQEPDRSLNNERRKAGLKPFVRYHTINIEPMKKVLKTEGNSEVDGLKRALHICRGHFSTYSEEKPLFGRIAGTFWIPSHVRGSIKEGVVVSDYNVKS
jgi:hypothetical protein